MRREQSHQSSNKERRSRFLPVQYAFTSAACLAITPFLLVELEAKPLVRKFAMEHSEALPIHRLCFSCLVLTASMQLKLTSHLLARCGIHQSFSRGLQ